MIDSFNKYTRNLLIACLIIVMLGAATNIYVDPYEIFGIGFLKRPYEPNLNYAVIRHLKDNHQKYNSYLMGSSRVGNINPKTLGKYIPNSVFYNVTTSICPMVVNWVHLKYFIENNYNIETLLIQIDIDTMFDKAEIAQDDYLRKEHPLVSGQNIIEFYLSYLSIMPIRIIWGKLLLNLKDIPYKLTYDINNSGMIIWWYSEEEIKINHENYIKTHFPKLPIVKNISSNRIVEKNLYYLRKIKEMCDRRGIPLILFVTPHNHIMMDSFDRTKYVSLLKDIASISSFYNFSGYNYITNNDNNYYEISHFRPYVGDLMIERMFNNIGIRKDTDFGIKVTRKDCDLGVKVTQEDLKPHVSPP